MSKKLLQLYGLKWNPFLADVPIEALVSTPRIQSFAWRIEHLAREGGFATAIGDSSTGKSAALRIVADHLGGIRDLVVRVLTRPQANLADFYREMGDLFGLVLKPHNRWAGAKALRETWFSHVHASHLHPVVFIDEAQEARTDLLSELRILASSEFDARALLSVVLAGDRRLLKRFGEPDLVPLDNRIRVRVIFESATRDELTECLRHRLDKAGHPSLLTPEVISTLAEHAQGNYRTLLTMANDLLLAGLSRQARQLDEKLFFEVFTPIDKRSMKPAGRGR